MLVFGKDGGVGARADLLAAVRWLGESGIEAFSPAQLIAEPRRLGARNPNSTLGDVHRRPDVCELVGQSRDAVRRPRENRPGTVYARRARQGEARSGYVGAQARTYFGSAVLSGVLMRSENPDSGVELVFLDKSAYSTLAGRAAGPLAQCGVAIWLVDEDWSVRTVV